MRSREIEVAACGFRERTLRINESSGNGAIRVEHRVRDSNEFHLRLAEFVNDQADCSSDDLTDSGRTSPDLHINREWGAAVIAVKPAELNAAVVPSVDNQQIGSGRSSEPRQKGNEDGSTEL